MTGYIAGAREVAVVPGVDEGREPLEFLVGLEDVSGEVAGGLDRPGVLSRQQFGRGSRGRAGGPPGCLRRMCSPGPGRVEFMAAVRRTPSWHLAFGPASTAGRGSPGCPRGDFPSWAERGPVVQIRLANEGDLFGGGSGLACTGSVII